MKDIARFNPSILIALLSLAALIVVYQTHRLMQLSMAGGSATGIIAQSMVEHLDGVSAGITAYIQKHDAESLERIKSEGREASRLLIELKENAVQDGTASAFTSIEMGHEKLREATLNLLTNDQVVGKRRQALGDALQTLVSFLANELQPSIRPSQLNSAARQRAVASAIAEAKSLSPNQDAGSDWSSTRSKFRREIATYQELSRTRRSDLWADRANMLLDHCMSAKRVVEIAEQDRHDALEAYRQKRKALDKTLQDSGSALGWGRGLRSVKRLLSSGFLPGLWIGLLLAGCGFIVSRSQRASEKMIFSPIDDIVQCLEAAAAGDLSRSPVISQSEELGKLAKAAGKLIGVLSRSENLVYHLAALVESSGEAIISHTLDGTILSWNKGAQRIYGYSAEEVKGHSIMILSPRDSDSELMNHLEKVRRGERVQAFEAVHVARNGRHVRALVRVSAILDSTRRPIGASFSAQELTDSDHRSRKSIENKERA